MHRLFFAFLALILGEQVLAADHWAAATNRAESTACCLHGGVPDSNVASQNIRIIVEPEDVVYVIKQESNRLLVSCSLSGFQGWFDQSHFVREASFRPITDWKGQRQFSFWSEDGGTKRVYRFSKDGTFTALEDSDEDTSGPGSYSTWAGRLYKYKRILWAKGNDRHAALDDWNLLRLERNGTACFVSIQASQQCK